MYVSLLALILGLSASANAAILKPNLALEQSVDSSDDGDFEQPVNLDDVDASPADVSDLDFASYIAWLKANPTMTDEERETALPSLRAGTPGQDYDATQEALDAGIDLEALEAQANGPMAQLYTPVGGCSVDIRVNLTTQSMTLSKNGGPAQSWAVSSGMQGRATPTGCYGVVATMKMAYSAAYNNAKMPNAVFFIKSVKNGKTRYTHALHAGVLPKKPASGYGLSHGCVRQAYANSLTTYNAAIACRGGTRICIVR